MDYQAKLSAPFGMLGIRCDDKVLRGIDFLPAAEKSQVPDGAIAKRVCEQLLNYFENPDAGFSIPLDAGGTHHQQKVWQAMLEIPRGQTRTYGEIATELHSCAQAVGQACGANPIPIIIPCHRVVGKSGLGGFARHDQGAPLDIKRWLLAHEEIPNQSMSLVKPLAIRLSPQAGKSLVIPRKRESSSIKMLDSGSSPE